MIVKKARNHKAGSSKSARVTGVANYIVEPQRDNGLEKCIHHEAENFLTDTHEGHVAEMIALAQDAVRSKDPIDHWVLSWAPNERPSVEQVREAVKLFMGHCGLTGHQVIWGLHDDTQNAHVHIAVNRVHPDTLKVVEINKGFQLNAAHQAIAIIEKKQGWKSVENARYQTNDNGELLTDRKTQRPAVNQAQNRPRQPTSQARDMEVQTGQKSAQRIGIEQAAPIIAQAKSWADLHDKMAAAGMEYRREGSGAKVYVGDVAVKASDVDRKASFGNLQKRFGLYQPAHQAEIKNDPHGRTRLIDNPLKNPFEQDTHPARFGTFNTLLNLPGGDLARGESSTQRKSTNPGLLQSHESADHRRTAGMRRGGDSDKANRGYGNSKNGRSAGEETRLQTGNAAGQGSKKDQPLNKNQSGWNAYILIREAQKCVKTHETLALQKRHGDERAALLAKLKAQRTDVLQGNWQGKGAGRNAMQSLLATLQAAEKLELSEQHREERKALQARYKPLPMYKQWKEQPQIVGIDILPAIEQRIARDKQLTVAQTLRSLTHTVDTRRHITYQLDRKDVFRDEGRSIQILDLTSSRGMAAALATAQQKFGNVLTLTGSPAFQQNAVAVAVANSLSCRFADPALDQLRERLQGEKYQAERQARQAQRDRAAAAQLEKSREPEPVSMVPVHSPSNKTREPEEPGLVPNAPQLDLMDVKQPQTQAADAPPVDHPADIHKQRERGNGHGR